MSSQGFSRIVPCDRSRCSFGQFVDTPRITRKESKRLESEIKKEKSSLVYLEMNYDINKRITPRQRRQNLMGFFLASLIKPQSLLKTLPQEYGLIA